MNIRQVITMAISLEDKLKTLPIERQEAIKKATDKLIREEYALREKEKKEKIRTEILIK